MEYIKNSSTFFRTAQACLAHTSLPVIESKKQFNHVKWHGFFVARYKKSTFCSETNRATIYVLNSSFFLQIFFILQHLIKKEFCFGFILLIGNFTESAFSNSKSTLPGVSFFFDSYFWKTKHLYISSQKGPVTGFISNWFFFTNKFYSFEKNMFLLKTNFDFFSSKSQSTFSFDFFSFFSFWSKRKKKPTFIITGNIFDCQNLLKQAASEGIPSCGFSSRADFKTKPTYFIVFQSNFSTLHLIFGFIFSLFVKKAMGRWFKGKILISKIKVKGSSPFLPECPKNSKENQNEDYSLFSFKNCC